MSKTIDHVIFSAIPPGFAVLGSRAHPERYPQFPMTITGEFYLQRRVVTQGEWRRVMGTEPWRESMKAYEYLGEIPFGDELPAINISQREALEYCKRMSSVLGVRVSLPPEAFWEYACRGGVDSMYYWGDNLEDGKGYENADWEGNGKPSVIMPPGTLRANPFGLYDMLANVTEATVDRVPDTGSAYIRAAHYTGNIDFVGLQGECAVLRGKEATALGRHLDPGRKAIILPGDRRAFMGMRMAIVPWLTP